MKASKAILIVILAVSIGATIPSPFIKELPSPPCYHGTLKNGLEYMIEERPNTETIIMGIFVRGGTRDEKEELVGLTGLFASLLMRGSEEMSGDEIARILEGRGVMYGASSDYLSIALRAYMPSDEFVMTFDILGKIILSLPFREEDIEKEKRLKLADLDMQKDIPQALFYDEIYRSLFPHHPLGYYAGFTRDSLNRIQRESLASFHATYVVPNNLLVVIIGNVSHETALEKIEQIFGSMDRREIPEAQFSTVTVTIPSGVREAVKKRTTEQMIWLGFRTEGIAESEKPALSVLNVILGEFQMRLWNEIRKKRGYAYWVSIDSISYPDIGVWGASAGIQKKYLKEVEEIMRSEFARISIEPVTDEELATAKRFLKTNLSRAMDVNSGHFRNFSSALLEGTPLRTEEELLQRIDRITKEDVQKIAARLFKNRNYSLFTLY